MRVHLDICLRRETNTSFCCSDPILFYTAVTYAAYYHAVTYEFLHRRSFEVSGRQIVICVFHLFWRAGAKLKYAESTAAERPLSQAKRVHANRQQTPNTQAGTRRCFSGRSISTTIRSHLDTTTFFTPAITTLGCDYWSYTTVPLKDIFSCFKRKLQNGSKES